MKKSTLQNGDVLKYTLSISSVGAATNSNSFENYFRPGAKSVHTFSGVQDSVVGVLEKTLNGNAEARQETGGKFRVSAKDAVAICGIDQHFTVYG